MGGAQKQSHPSKKKENKSAISVFAITSELGFAIALPIVAGAFIGQILDTQWGTSPKMTLFLILFGIIFSIISVYKLLKEIP